MLSRAAKIVIDARFSGYEFYHCFDYSIFIALNGDSLDRYLLRFNEIIESCRMIYAILYVMLKSIHWTLIGTAFHNSSALMVDLINEFFIRFPFILSLINELKLSIESFFLIISFKFIDYFLFFLLIIFIFIIFFLFRKLLILFIFILF